MKVVSWIGREVLVWRVGSDLEPMGKRIILCFILLSLFFIYFVSNTDQETLLAHFPSGWSCLWFRDKPAIHQKKQVNLKSIEPNRNETTTRKAKCTSSAVSVHSIRILHRRQSVYNPSLQTIGLRRSIGVSCKEGRN